MTRKNEKMIKTRTQTILKKYWFARDENGYRTLWDYAKNKPKLYNDGTWDNNDGTWDNSDGDNDNNDNTSSVVAMGHKEVIPIIGRYLYGVKRGHCKPIEVETIRNGEIIQSNRAKNH